MRWITILKFGGLAAVGLAAWTLMAWQLGWHNQDFTHAQHGKKFAGAVFVACLWLAVRERRHRQGGAIEFGEGFQTAVITGAVAAFLNGAFVVFYTRVLNPGWLQRAWEWQKAGLLAAGAKEAEVGRHEAISNVSQQLIFQLLLEPIRTCIMGLILATAIAAAMRRKPLENSEAPPAALPTPNP